MSIPTVIRHTERDGKIYQVITYSDETFSAAYVCYEMDSDRPVLITEEPYRYEEGAITEYLLAVL